MEGNLVSWTKDGRQSLNDIQHGWFKPFQISRCSSLHSRYYHNYKNLSRENISVFIGQVGYAFYFVTVTDLEWAIELNRFTLRVIGLWPKAEQIPWEKLKCNLHVLIIVLIMIFNLLVPCTRSLVIFHEDILIIFEHIKFIAPGIICVVKLLIFWWKKEALIPIMRIIMEDWLARRNGQERAIMMTWAQRTRIVTSTAYFVMAAGYFYLIFLPFFGISTTYSTNITDKLLPFPSYYEYDVAKRPQYELTYISHAIVIFFVAISYTGIDNFLGLAIAIIEDTYNVMLLALFLYFGMSFAFFGFLIVSLVEEGDHQNGRIILCVYAATVVFVHIGLYCGIGEILVAQCDKFYDAIYIQKWYSLNSRNAKDLILLMIRSGEVSYITAGKIFPLTMVTFSNLLKTSAGYVSVLLTIRN